MMKLKFLIYVVAALAFVGCARHQSQAARTTDENVDVTKIYNIVILKCRYFTKIYGKYVQFLQ